MPRFSLSRLVITTALPVLMVGGLFGCTSNDPANQIPLTESDAARLEAQNIQEKQRWLERGEELVSDGQAERARGQAMVDQGDTVKGQPMVASGNAKIAQGNALIDRANAMETDVEPIQVNTQGSNATTRRSN